GPGSPEEELVLVFGDRPGLLVLDNAEHVLDGVARLAEVLLGRCHRLRLLVTSRSRMVVPFERVIDLAPLSLGPDGDAVDLLADRAGCALDRSRAARICAAVGGLPLAVELAAGRIATLGIDGVEAALEDQVRLLVGGMREDQRHRSLTATLDWSYDLLTP